MHERCTRISGSADEEVFTDPWNFDRPKDGESIRDVLARTKEFWEELIHNPKLQDKTILIASHGCAVRALLHNVYKDHEDFWHGFVPELQCECG